MYGISLDTDCLSENRLGEGDSPILLRGLRKIETVPDSFRIGNKQPDWARATGLPAAI
jgi:hypothetical protein